jgi:protein-disulfide isomerase
MNENFFKYLSVFLLGLILGFSISKVDFSGMAVSSQTGTGSVKIMGSNNAPVTIVEYSDFQCPFCEKYFTETYPEILKKYVETGKVKYQFKHFPLQIHAQAPAAGLASECALEQGKFWEMHDQLFKTQNTWAGSPDHLNFFKKLATDIQLNQDQFNQCIDSGKYTDNINYDFSEGLNKGITGTPTFYINGQTLIGAQDISAFSNIIDQALAAQN